MADAAYFGRCVVAELISLGVERLERLVRHSVTPVAVDVAAAVQDVASGSSVGSHIAVALGFVADAVDFVSAEYAVDFVAELLDATVDVAAECVAVFAAFAEVEFVAADNIVAVVVVAKQFAVAAAQLAAAVVAKQLAAAAVEQLVDAALPFAVA